MTSKQRAYLKGLAMTIDPVTQIGKEGLSDALTISVDQALHKRELIKLAVLQTSPVSARDAAPVLEERLRCKVVQVIGNRIVLYRRNREKPKLELPK